MENADRSAEELRSQIAALEHQLDSLKDQLASIEAAAAAQEQGPERHGKQDGPSDWRWPLAPEDYERYGRQLILPSIGIQGRGQTRPVSSVDERDMLRRRV